MFDGVAAFDLVIISLVTCYFIYLLLIHKFKQSQCSNPESCNHHDIKDDYSCQMAGIISNGSCLAQDECCRAGSNDHVVVLFGSQTGTAISLSKSVRKTMLQAGVKCSIKDPSTVNPDEVVQWSKRDQFLLVFVVATYGDGQPTDNFLPLWSWLFQDDPELSGLNFSVFGLGDRSYHTFNNVGRNLDKKLQSLGATRFFQFVAGDVSQNMDQMFMRWKDKLVKKMCATFPSILDPVLSTQSHTEFKLIILDDILPECLFAGEPHACGSFRTQKRPFSQKNPFLAPIKQISYLGSQVHHERSCIQVVLDISDSKIKYSPGDHLGIYPQNSDESVNILLNLLQAHPSLLIDMVPNDASQSRPFPCPCTLYTALKYYLDINQIVSREFLMDMIPFALVKTDRDFLRSLVDPVDQSMYENWIVKDGRNLISVLQDIPMIQPPFDLVLESLPRLNVRYYSISSSQHVTPNEVHLTVGLHSWVSGGRRLKGVCSNFIRSRNPGDSIPIFVKKNPVFHLPSKSIYPVLMIASGTGIAPFIGFLHHRQHHLKNKDQGQKTGNMILFYGCRSKESSFWYEDELDRFEMDGVLSQKFVVDSNDKIDRVYIVDEIKKHYSLIWLNIQLSAVFYICGGKRNFVNDVMDALCYAVHHGGEMDEVAASAFVTEMKNNKRILFDVWVEE